MTPKRLGNTALKLPGSCQSNFLCFHGSWLQVISIFRISSWPKVYGCVEASIPMKKEPCSCIHLAVHLSILLSIHPCMHASICPLIHLSMHACIHVSIHSSIYPPLHICIHPSIYLSIHPCIHPLSNLFTHPFIHPIIHPPSIHPFTHSSTVHPLTHSSIHPPVHATIHSVHFAELLLLEQLGWGTKRSKKKNVYLLPSVVLHFCSWKCKFTQGVSVIP